MDEQRLRECEATIARSSVPRLTLWPGERYACAWPMDPDEEERFWLSVDRVRHQSSACFPCHCGGLSLILEQTQIHRLTINSELRGPFPIAGFPAHTAKCRRRPLLARHVLRIRTILRDDSQVTPPVVEFVPVDVVTINPIALSKSEQVTVHIAMDNPVGTVGGAGNVHAASGVPRRQKVPAPLTDPFGIDSIDQRVGAYRPVTSVQRNPRSQAVIVQNRWTRRSVTGSRAERARARVFLGIRWCSRERRAATVTSQSNARQWTGTLRTHLGHSRCQEPGCLRSAGSTSCLDFTISATAGER